MPRKKVKTVILIRQRPFSFLSLFLKKKKLCKRLVLTERKKSRSDNAYYYWLLLPAFLISNFYYTLVSISFFHLLRSYNVSDNTRSISNWCWVFGSFEDCTVPYTTYTLYIFLCEVKTHEFVLHPILEVVMFVIISRNKSYDD